MMGLNSTLLCVSVTICDKGVQMYRFLKGCPAQSPR